MSLIDPKSPHIVLVGFMGAGKSVVGTALSERLGIEFIDVDAMVEQHVGKTVGEIFRESGEVAFRARERAAMREALAGEEPSVIGTGGGVFVDDVMRAAVLRASRSVYLKVSPSVVMERVGQGQERKKRPLLSGPDPELAIERLMKDRESAYSQAEFHVDTCGRDVDSVVTEVLRLLELEHAPKAQMRSVSRERAGQRHSRPAASVAANDDDAGSGLAGPVAAGVVSDSQEDGLGLAVPALGGSPEFPQLWVRSRGGDYRVELRPGAGSWIAAGISARLRSDRVVIISDSNVSPLHAERILADIRALGRDATLLHFEAGENSKNLQTIAKLYDALCDLGLGRQDALVSVGGGVVGDVTGFVASTFLRGIGFFQVPTTTLAAVDASVGGKTGVNTARGKNLVGTFAPPLGVFIALEHLQTQQRHSHATGLCEALKMAVTLDSDLLELINKNAQLLLDFDSAALLEVVARSVQLKAAVVSADELEHGLRAVLNYGHTIGHAIESGENYAVAHGEAVAMGMIAEAEWAQSAGVGGDVVAQLSEALSGLGLSTGWTMAQIDFEALKVDKKRLGVGTVRMPVVVDSGSHVFEDVSLKALAEFVKTRSGG